MGAVFRLQDRPFLIGEDIRRRLVAPVRDGLFEVQ